ncbi:MAG: MBL fold metallo-hydrolase [Bacteroidales bacterium]|nr:MBL fold metallo-hydrolase [Lachnoclostridium sp.]MCM1385360.1 MBL fold metallo-hydrolase [Lachnoclostridium sp.]MCM1465994.1 MBL fold metallo-hydrolase [Bacteroidales bacterium]
MYELVQISEKCYYINCPAKIGIYVADSGKVYLIDSGNDKDAGRKVRQILEQKGWRPAAILNTHSNADHIGGNRYLQGQTGCKVYSGGIEAAFTKFPVLEPSFLYGGYPCKDLRHKFLMAQESEVTDFSDEDFPKEVEVIPLPGHFFDMVGFRIPDGTVFLADCLSSRETLEKYAVSFIYDVGEYLKTLDKVENMEGAVFVPAHAEVSTDIGELVRYNRNKVHEVEERILAICGEPHCFEEILREVFQGYGLTMNFEQYVLVGSTVRSYLSWLKDSGKLGIAFQDNMLLWQAV